MTYLTTILFAAMLAQPPEPQAGDRVPPSGERPKPGGVVISPGDLPTKAEQRSRELLEAEFKEMMTDAVLVGSWQMTSGTDGQAGRLTDPRTDKYTINGAAKLSDEIWVISARIEFANNDVTIPIPVRVVWAEDTPIITLDDFSVPMLGTYSCRVILHHGFYSGIWYSNVKNYGGVMSGRVVKSKDAVNVKGTDDKPTKTELHE